jgi:phosphoglycolate phosphatase-like HAD superfamily hydrolase
MATRTADREERIIREAFAPVRTTIAGFAGTQLLTAFSSENYDPQGISTFTGATGPAGYLNVIASTRTGMSVDLVYTQVSSYRPEFVDAILAADKAKPEAKFDNVVDMLDWLSRE